MTPAERIIERCGGLTKLAVALGHKNVTTVQGWKVRGVVPSRQIPEIIEAARSLGVALTPADFFDLDDQTDQADSETAA